MFCSYLLLIFRALALAALSASLGFADQHGHDEGADAARVETVQLAEAAPAKDGAGNFNFFDRWMDRGQALSSSKGKRKRSPANVSSAVERSLDERVTAHFESIRTDFLIEYLAPAGWSVHFDLEDNRLQRLVVFHAETSRRKALDGLLSRIGLQGIFYPRSRVIIITQGGES